MNPLSFSQEEEKILAFWEKERVFERTLAKTKRGKPFVFYEGPPTANGRPGMHHVLARTFKDLMPRFQTMRGRFVARKAGWDTQGLPVEIAVEKKLGLKSKRDIENLVPGDKFASIAKFNEECKKSVWQYLEDWQKLTKRMGYWVDLAHPYITYEPKYIESLWHIIKQVHKKGLLKKSFRVQPFCPRCGTGLSSHELALGYKKVKERAVYVKFQITNTKSQINSKLQIPNPKTYLLSWTTTPWTLPGNVALAVSPETIYCQAEYRIPNTEYPVNLILAKERLSILKGEYKIVGEFKGADLVGLQYQPLFDIPELQNEKSHRVYAADFVTAKEGTGIVHTAVMYGEDDFKLGRKVGLPQVPTVNEDGTFNELVPGFSGKYVKAPETEAALIEHFKNKGAYLSEEQYEHDYPFCWRCGTPLLYMARTAWIIEMSKLKPKLIANNNKVKWEPAHIKEGRFGEWLKEAKDWTFSRERYWGTPLPVWECEKCERVKVVGSLAELSEKLPRNSAGEIDLHRPYIDEVKFECVCGGTMTRAPYVCDVWFDSGSMPFAQYHYPFENKALQAEQFPADYISEAVDQTRGWFYTLLAVATLLGKGPAYKRVICLGHLLDARGEKMSKSKGNIVEPWAKIAKFGIDSIRWYFLVASLPGLAKRYDPKAIRTHYNKFFVTLWNTFRFLDLYAPKKQALDSGLIQKKGRAKRHLLDAWVIARSRELTLKTTRLIEDLQPTAAARLIGEFVDDLSNWYVRRSRGRLQAGKDESRPVLASVLLNTTALIAPFTPFFGERLYLGLKLFLKGAELPASIHLMNWPKAPALTASEQKLISQMRQARELVAEGLKQRMAAGLKVRQPLAGAAVGARLPNEILEIIREELNIDSIQYSVSSIENSIKIDLNLTPELKLRGLIKELARNIQMARREMGLMPSDKIDVKIDESAMGHNLAIAFDNLLEMVNAREIHLIQIPPEMTGVFEADIGEGGVRFTIERVNAK